MLPIYLPNGIVAVYGLGGYNGNVIPYEDTDVRFGTIYQVYDGGAVFVYNNDSVMFKESQIVGRVIYNDYPYTLIPARLVTKQNPLD